MPSYLAKQSAAFKGDLASAANKIANPVSQKAASLAPPSPSPSAASDSTTPTTKRKRDVVSEIYSQPQLTGFGQDPKTQMTFAVDYLKQKGESFSMENIIRHLGLLSYEEKHKNELTELLRRHPRVDWKLNPAASESTWNNGTYSHRPIIPDVKDATSLLAHLQRKTDASGVSVKDLKDGWPDCEDTIANLEKQHKILVVRTKKDNFPRFVWPNDASLHHKVQPEFQVMWHRVPLPSLEDMHRKLVSVGQKPTSDDPRKLVGVAKPKAQKKRAGKRIGKATNTHMQHLMQDYSGMRR